MNRKLQIENQFLINDIKFNPDKFEIYQYIINLNLIKIQILFNILVNDNIYLSSKILYIHHSKLISISYTDRSNFVFCRVAFHSVMFLQAERWICRPRKIRPSSGSWRNGGSCVSLPKLWYVAR